MESWKRTEQLEPKTYKKDTISLTCSAAARSVPIVKPKGIVEVIQRRRRRGELILNLRFKLLMTNEMKDFHDMVEFSLVLS